jgi:integrase
MPRKTTLTHAAVMRLKVRPGEEQTDYFDAGFPGLALRVSRLGRKSWTYHCRVDGKQKRITFDVFPAMSVEAAHDAWRRARDMVRAGRDPSASMAPSAPTDFESVFEDWMRRDQANNRSAGIQRQSLTKDVLPHWRGRDISTIGRRDCLDVVDILVDRGHPIAARRLHARLHRLFQWALGRGIVEANPLAGVDKPGRDIPRDRALSDGELAAVWAATEQLGYPYGPAYQLLILTGARLDEIGSLRWAELNGGIVKLPGTRTKNKETHVIPLSAPARALLEALPRIAGSDFVFTTTGTRGLTAWSRAKVKIDDSAGVAPWHTHDLRRTVAIGLQRLSVPLAVTESVLGHTSGSRSGIVGVYQAYDYAPEKAAALEAWGAHVMALVEGREPGKVVAFGGR